MSVLKWQVSSFSNFALFFIVMTHNFSVNFKVIPFLLWTKGSHQSPNFDTFKCSGENLPNFSCLFSNHWSVFLQNLHNSSLSWKITPLYFCSSSNIYFGHKEPIKMSILKRQVSSSSNFVSFFIVMKHNSTLNLKLIHFLLGKVEMFETFECSAQNFSNSLCQFWNEKSIPPKILYPFSVL